MLNVILNRWHLHCSLANVEHFPVFGTKVFKVSLLPFIPPGDAPRNTIVGIINTTAIYMEWDPPLTPNGVIIHYTIYTNGYQPLNVKATSGARNISIGGFSPYQTLEESLSASTGAGEGPWTVPQRITTQESGRVNI